MIEHNEVEEQNEICILMSTYNGEKYIVEQIDSILSQTYRKFKLIIRDDYSTDNTAIIIKEYEAKDSRIEVILGDSNYGHVKSFAWLTEKARGQKYVMYCDQDDVWENNKIENSYRKMIFCEQIYGTENPILIFCNKNIVDKDLRPIQCKKNYKPKITFWDILTQNSIYGCTTMVNSKLLEKVFPYPQYVNTHDYYIALIASTFGHICYIDDELIKYRQHSANVTGGDNNYDIMYKFKHLNDANLGIHATIRQNYYYCKTKCPPDNAIAKKYINIVESKGIMKIIRAIKYSYKIDGVLQNCRLYYALYSFKL